MVGVQFKRKNYTSAKNASQMSLDELRKNVARMAKTANTRLKALEDKDLVDYKIYKNISKAQHAGASGLTLSRGGQPRFSRAVKSMSQHELEKEYTRLEKFLGSQTSTVGGIHEVNEKAYQSFVKTHPDISRDEYSQMWGNEMTKAIERIGGSDRIVNLVVKDIKSGVTMEDINKKLEDTHTLYGYRKASVETKGRTPAGQF